ncbi:MULTISPECIES: glycosyltransferase [unclassified Kaistella]|uniref:glycosyltransferase n=1 Tax=unclassified Kaistella TaxID=2762626 RepID=UPI0027348D1D|nr:MULTISPECIES: glycosyltransferase [unclassified Kaistella]MDP2452523.1 glycosyltransferase [Kaistella sp. SH11-4b]MDP2455431.1 glycosyltransferase [Kaistella sp. SH40-3]MDP2458335.1 glycosyltransferase [Kaistella sp. SH19-2b]
MTKILFLIPTLMHGGAEKVLVNLANNLDPTKYDVTLYSIFDEGINKQFLQSHVKYRSRFNKVFRGNSLLMKLFSPKVLYRFFIKENYDIVVSYLEGPAARIISGCENPEIQKIAWIHIELNNEKEASVGFISVNSARKAYEKFDRIVAVSETVGECFKKNMTTKVPLQVLYNTNETDQIRKLGLEPVENVFEKEILQVCSVAKIAAPKGFDRLLIAHKQLMDEGLPHHINILGIGPEQEKLEKKAKELGVSESFRFLGFHQNPYQYVSKCDLYVCSSHTEGFSTAVSEALILGIPVVSTNCSGALEMLGENNEYGIVTENSTEGIYQGMKQMLSDRTLLDHYRSQAKLRGSFFSTANTVKAVENLLDEI